jgi:hypothetical protein
MSRSAADRPTAYRGPWPILSHRTLAELGAGVGPAVIIEGKYREVQGQRFRITPDHLRDDPRMLQQRWDEEAGQGPRIVPDHAAQFREINAALRGPEPDEPPTVMRIAILIGGAGLIAGVVTAIAIAVRLFGGQ